MGKKILISLIILTMMLSTFVGCVTSNSDKNQTQTTTQQNEEETKDASPSNPYEKELVITAAKYGTEYPVDEEDLQNKILKEKYNFTVEYDYYPSSEFETKLNLLFATGDEPDWMPLGRYGLTNWTNAGYLRPFTTEEIKNKIPNFIEYYGDEWEDLYNAIKHTDGNIYYLAWKPNDKVRMGYQYRKEAFDKLNLSFPKTTDEYYAALKAIKEAYPDKIPLLMRGGLWAIADIFQMFWIPELAVSTDSYFVDPKTGEFVPYALTEPEAREALIFMNKLYKEGLLYQEFSTATRQQTDALSAQGHGFFQWGYPGNEEERNEIYRDAVPDVNWVYSTDMITAYPERGYIYRREALHYEWGTVITKKAGEEKAARLMDYINWGLSDEGLRFHNLGVEGVTYEIVNGKPMFKDHMYYSPDSNKDTAKRLQNYGIFDQWFSGHPARSKMYDDTDVRGALGEAFTSKPDYYFFRTPPMLYTEEENKIMADKLTAVNDIRDEYLYKFIMGNLDPAKDEDWNSYVDAMKRVGLDEIIELRKTVYERTNK